MSHVVNPILFRLNYSIFWSSVLVTKKKFSFYLDSKNLHILTYLNDYLRKNTFIVNKFNLDSLKLVYAFNKIRLYFLLRPKKNDGIFKSLSLSRYIKMQARCHSCIFNAFKKNNFKFKAFAANKKLISNILCFFSKVVYHSKYKAKKIKIKKLKAFNNKIRIFKSYYKQLRIIQKKAPYNTRLFKMLNINKKVIFIKRIIWFEKLYKNSLFKDFKYLSSNKQYIKFKKRSNRFLKYNIFTSFKRYPLSFKNFFHFFNIYMFRRLNDNAFLKKNSRLLYKFKRKKNNIFVKVLTSKLYNNRFYKFSFNNYFKKKNNSSFLRFKIAKKHKIYKFKGIYNFRILKKKFILKKMFFKSRKDKNYLKKLSILKNFDKSKKLYKIWRLSRNYLNDIKKLYNRIKEVNLKNKKFKALIKYKFKRKKRKYFRLKSIKRYYIKKKNIYKFKSNLRKKKKIYRSFKLYYKRKYTIRRKEKQFVKQKIPFKFIFKATIYNNKFNLRKLDINSRTLKNYNSYFTKQKFYVKKLTKGSDISTLWWNNFNIYDLQKFYLLNKFKYEKKYKTLFKFRTQIYAPKHELQFINLEWIRMFDFWNLSCIFFAWMNQRNLPAYKLNFKKKGKRAYAWSFVRFKKFRRDQILLKDWIIKEEKYMPDSIFYEDLFYSIRNGMRRNFRFGSKRIFFMKRFTKNLTKRLLIKTDKNVLFKRFYKEFLFLLRYYIYVIPLKKKITQDLSIMFNFNMSINIYFVVRKWKKRIIISARSIFLVIKKKIFSGLYIKKIIKKVVSRLQTIYNRNMIDGFAILFCGRFNKKDRAVYEWAKFGKFTRSTRISKIDYYFGKLFLKYSTCSFKISIMRNNYRHRCKRKKDIFKYKKEALKYKLL